MPWFRLVNKHAEQNTARVDIYDRIGETYDFWRDETVGLAARDFSATLVALGDVTQIELHINSPGGSVVEGLQIYNELRAHPATITVKIDGMAGSIAAVIAMAGDTVIMPENTSLFVHNPVAQVYQNLDGDSKDWRKEAQKLLNLAATLDTIEAQMINTFLAKAGDKLTADTLKALMDKDTTITAKQALAYGLADEVAAPFAAAACANMPDVLAQAQAQLQQRLKPPKAAPTTPPEPPSAMAAKDVIAACQAAALPELAAEMIVQGCTDTQVKAHLALAQQVKDLAVAGEVANLTQPLIQAAMAGPVQALQTALSIRFEAGEAVIDNGTPSHPTTPAVIDVQAIYAQRQQAQRAKPTR